jgi:serine acetyltransferase
MTTAVHPAEGSIERGPARTLRPSLPRSVRADAKVTRAFRGEGARAPKGAREVLDAIRLVWVSDAFAAQVAWRTADALCRRHIPVIPWVLRAVARALAQVDIDAAATIAPGLYIAHGQVRIHGPVVIGGSVVLFPWVSVEADADGAPRIERDVHLGTGSTIRGPVVVGAGARIGANARVFGSVAPGSVAVGVVTADAADAAEVATPAAPDRDAGARDPAPPARTQIEELSAANRVAPATDVERRLIRLRHEAFAHVVHEAPAFAWPPPCDDRYAGVADIPEIAAAALTGDAIRAGVIGRGALIVRGLLPPTTARRLIEHIDLAFAGQDAWAAAGEIDGDYGPWFAPFEPGPDCPPMTTPRHWVGGGGGVFAADSPRAAFHVLDAFAAAGVVDAVADHLGERPALSGKKWTLRRVPLAAGTSWHQDGAFLGEGLRTVNVWIALSSAGETAPGLEVVARRFDEILPTGTEGAFFEWSVSDAVAREAAGDHPIVRPVFAPGDAILFDDMTLHRTLVTAAMTEPRYAIESWFFAPSAYPDGGVPLVP